MSPPNILIWCAVTTVTGLLTISLLKQHQLPGAGPNLKATRQVSSSEAMEARAKTMKLPAEAREDKSYKLVVETLTARDGTTIYCVHWQPCTTCEFQCLK